MLHALLLLPAPFFPQWHLHMLWLILLGLAVDMLGNSLTGCTVFFQWRSEVLVFEMWYKRSRVLLNWRIKKSLVILQRHCMCLLLWDVRFTSIPLFQHIAIVE